MVGCLFPHSDEGSVEEQREKNVDPKDTPPLSPHTHTPHGLQDVHFLYNEVNAHLNAYNFESFHALLI